MSGSNILFILTGSISCFKACQIISRLVGEGHEVQTVCSKSALEFIGPATLEGLTSKEVLIDQFKPGHMMNHITAAKWADLAIICPATANTINKLSHGLADDLIGGLYLAFDRKKPFLIAPAMNQAMLRHPTTDQALKSLEEQGNIILPTEYGRQACGDEGPGRLADIELIVGQIYKHLQPQTKTPSKKILITHGGTKEPIDSVRCITNTSTGKTGAILADELIQEGHQVTTFSAENAIKPKNAKEIYTYSSFDSLSTLINQNDLSEYDAIIHLAAVSDFKVESLQMNEESYKASAELKLSSSAEAMTLHLHKNPKLLSLLREKAPDTLLVAFKLTHTLDQEKVREAVDQLFNKSHPNLVVHNDLNQMEQGKHPFNIFHQKGKHTTVMGAVELAATFNQILSRSKGEIL